MSVYQEQALFLLAESYFLASGLCMLREKIHRLSFLTYITTIKKIGIFEGLWTQKNLAIYLGSTYYNPIAF